MQEASVVEADALSARVGAVLVAHGRADLAVRCARTLHPEVSRERLVVVVNAPELAEAADLAALRQTATVVVPPRRQGYGANLNMGARSLPDGLDFWLLANDDIELRPGALKALLCTLAHNERTGAVGPSLVDGEGRPLPRPLNAPDATRFALHFARLLPLGPAWGLAERLFDSQGIGRSDSGRSEDWLLGAAMAVRADAFRSIGGFDEDFFLYFEETDFCFRLRAAGWQIAHEPTAEVAHVGGASTENQYWQVFLQSRRLYFLRRLGRARLLALQGVLFVVFVVGVAYHLLAAIVRPRSAHRRIDVVQHVWHRRIFFLGRRVRP